MEIYIKIYLNWQQNISFLNVLEFDKNFYINLGVTLRISLKLQGYQKASVHLSSSSQGIQYFFVAKDESGNLYVYLLM